MRKCAAIVLLLLGLAASARAVEPSANKGKPGTYLVETSRPGYNYYVCVPKSYSDNNPAGLHLYFHGQSGQAGAKYFDIWEKDFLERYNLIGINMQYMEGDNARDTAGKVASAIEAITQVCADYKVIRGRGVIASFSGGGLPHAMMTGLYGKLDAKPSTWPFNHSCLYDANYRRSVKGVASMSWFVAVGGGEWTLASLGSTQTGRAEELFDEALSGRCPDVHLKIIKGKGHEIAPEDIAASSEVFGRSDLPLAPFLYEADYAGTPLEAVAMKANLLDLGGAAADVKRVIVSKSGKPEVVEQARALGERIEKRVDAVLTLSKELSETDPVLWQWYGKVFARQLGSHPRAGELKKLLPLAPTRDKVKAREKDVVWVLTLYGKRLRSLFTDGGKLMTEAVPEIEKVGRSVGEKSLYGRMAAEFLLLK